MATLQKIRNKGVLLAVIIGGALFLFVIGDFLNSGSTFFHQSKNIVGEVNGDKLKAEEYRNLIDQLSTVYKFEYGMKDLKEEMNSQIRKSVWENFVNEKIIAAEAEKIGLSVSNDELMDRMMGKNIHPLISQRRVFADQRGQFSLEAVNQFYKTVFETPENQLNEESRQQIADARKYWLFWEKAVKNAVLTEKYAALIAKTTGSNSIEAKYVYNAGKETGDVSYVMQPYFSVSDSSIQVSNDELKARYEKDKELFKQEASRSVNYVLFDVTPLPEDFKKAEEWNKKVSEKFKTTTDIVDLVNNESDISYDGRKYTMETVPANLKDFAFNNSTGASFGPVFQNNTYTMAKIMESGIMESDSLKLAMIAVSNEKTADSIMTAIKGGANFGEMAKKHSLAQESAANGGEVGWVPVKAAGPEIEKNASNKGAGDLFKIVSPQGVQIFKIDEKSPARRKVKLAILEHKVTTSDQSKNTIYNNAIQFAASSTSAEKFEKTAKEKGYVVRPATNIDENADQLNMIPLSREAVKWAFRSKKGKVSDVIKCGNDENFIVETVTEINPKGYQSLEKVTPQLKAEIIKDKKAEIITKNLSGLLAKYPTLETLATAINAQAKVAPAVNFNSFQFGDAGFEPYIIGKASIISAGKTSAPLKGNSGVYVIMSAAKQVTTAPFNAKMVSMQLDSRISNSLPYAILQKLREKYDIYDNRSNFY